MILALFYMSVCLSVAICYIDYTVVFCPFMFLSYVAFLFCDRSFERLKKRVESLEKDKKGGAEE